MLPRPDHLAAETASLNVGAEERAYEKRIHQLALPVALGGSFLLTASAGVRSFVRIFFSMWLHELGHAISAWLSGYSALPGPWRTSISDTRSYVVAILFAAGFVRYGQLSFQAERYGRVALVGAILVVQALCTLVAADSTARAFFTFSGDGGALVLSALLMCTVYAKPGTRLHRGALRWGFLVIGAFSFWDVYRTWLGAKADPAAIPFGAIEGVGLSDPTKLVEQHGWSEPFLINAYVGLGTLLLALLTARYLSGLILAQRSQG